MPYSYHPAIFYCSSPDLDLSIQFYFSFKYYSVVKYRRILRRPNHYRLKHPKAVSPQNYHLSGYVDSISKLSEFVLSCKSFFYILPDHFIRHISTACHKISPCPKVLSVFALRCSGKPYGSVPLSLKQSFLLLQVYDILLSTLCDI